MDSKVMLIIMDGWGIGPENRSNAIFSAKTPFIDSLKSNPDVAYTTLQASGLAVGLPDGQMGNSEVGHLNLGAGRIVYQDLVRINKAVAEGSMENNETLRKAFDYTLSNEKNLHLVGLISDGGVHSMDTHLIEICRLAEKSGLKNVFIHAIMDGRDTDPHSGLRYLSELIPAISSTHAKIASVIGRYYTMDRDKRWERVKTGYDLMVNGIGKTAIDPLQAIRDSYNEGITDEFIKPVIITGPNNLPLATLKPGDAVFCFNFRTDRLRELTTVLTQKDMPEAGMNTIPLYYLTMTRYDESFKNVHVVFDNVDLTDTIGELIAKNGKKQLRIAETEKYPHVTFFFSGGREEPFAGEERILIPSPRVPTYDLQPEMSAPGLTRAVTEALNRKEFTFICLNFANSDMVGHTGVYPAICKAVETVDSCVETAIGTAVKNGYSVILTADHGNADYAINDDGSPNTAHSCNPVPCYLINSPYHKISPGKLSDIAPTVLKLLHLPQPPAMTGQSLV